MRFVIYISVFFIVIVSCKTVVPVEVSEISKESDTIQFTYLYSEGLKYRMLGNNEKSKDIFLQCLNIEKKSSASAYQLSEIYFKEENFDSAVIYAEFCLKIKPENEWYLINRAKIAVKLNENEKYITIYKKLSTLYPDNLNYNFELAIIYFNEKKYDESLIVLNNIEETIGIDESVSFLKNSIFFEQKKYDAIHAELLKLKVFYPDSVKYQDLLAEFYLNTNQPESAFNLYRNILKLDTGNIYAKYGIAILYAKSNQFVLGYPYLKSVLENFEINVTKKETLTALYLDAPDKILNNDQISFIYKSLIDLEGISIEIINDYLEYLFKLRQITDVEKIAKLSTKKFPENFWGWDYVFKVLIMQSRIEELNTFALKALEYFPNHAQIYFYVGYSYFLMKKANDAITYFESGIGYVPDNKSLELEFLLYLAESYHSVGKHKKSDEYFEMYLKKDTSNANLMNNYAFYLLSRNKDIDRAAQLSMKSIEIEPFNSSFLDTYSWILYIKNQYTKALNFIERSYRYGGNKNPIIIEHYGDILEKLGKAKEAIEKWEEAYSLNQNNENLRKKIDTYKLQNK
jgi:tetratricopeptide (TPR) repeat protein